MIIIIMAGIAVFNVAGYLIEERRRWPAITASRMNDDKTQTNIYTCQHLKLLARLDTSNYKAT